jgi:hypothetical protein
VTRSLLSIALLLLLACGGVKPVPPGPPVPSTADAIEQCAAICDRLDTLRCQGRDGNAGPDEVVGTPDDVSCEKACVDVQAVVALNANCVVEAGSCRAVDACGN